MNHFKIINIVVIFYLIAIPTITYGDGFCINQFNTKKTYAKLSGSLVFYEKIRNTCEECVYNNIRMSPSASVSAALGYNFNKNISAEILGRFSIADYEYNEAEAYRDSQQIKFYTLFVNFYYKHAISKNFIPYIVLGPGYTFNRSSTFHAYRGEQIIFPNFSTPGKNINSFVWNLGFGTILNLKNNCALDIGYRYMYLGRIGVKSNSTFDSLKETRHIKAHELTLGLVYKF